MNNKLELNRAEVAKLLEDDDTFAFVLMVILLTSYGDDTFTEEPVVLFKNLEEDFHCKLSDETENRINAALIAMTTDLVYTNPDVFKAVALAFTEGDIGGIPNGEDEELDGSAALWAITEIGLLNNDGPDDEAFHKYSPTIHKLVRETIASVAQDTEEVPDDVDTVEEAMDTPYFIHRVNEDLKEICRQLLAINVDPEVVKELLESQSESFR